MSHSGKNPNPQGKGLVPVLQDWGALSPTVTGSRSSAAFLRDYCISSLIVGAYFKFKPVVGNTYYLYGGETHWTLSLVGPREWGAKAPGEFLAPCRLRPDMTWDIDNTGLGEAPALPRLQAFVEAFIHTLQGQASITGELPFYVEHLPYYQRMLATAMSSSLSQSGVDAQEVQRLANSGQVLLAVVDAPEQASSGNRR